MHSADAVGRFQGTLPAADGVTYTIDIYQNSVCDHSGHGEGEQFLASFSVTATGGVGIIDRLLNPPPTAGTFVSATATDPNGNTSEFGNCIAVTAGIFVVNTFGGSDSNIGNGACDTDNGTVGDQCSLRAAIEEINGLPNGPYRVNFAYSTDTAHLLVSNPLPTITTPIILDATTQPGATCPTETQSGTFKVKLAGGFGLPDGTHLLMLGTGSNGSEIRGFEISSAPGAGDGLYIQSDNNIIACNYIHSNGDDGVQVPGDGNRIGAFASYNDRNVLSNNGGNGVQVSGADNKIRGNFIGTNTTGNSTATASTCSTGRPTTSSAAIAPSSATSSLATARTVF